MNRKWLVLCALIPVLSCLCVGLLTVQGARAGGDRAATQTAVAQAFGLLRAACTGQVAGVAGAAAYAPSPGRHPVVAFRSRDTTTFERDPHVVASGQDPQSADETQLVACLDESWVTIESCAYDSPASGGARYVIRSQHQIKLRLIAAHSGESVATETLTGREPRACQETETFAVGTTRMTVSGEAIAPGAIQAWLEQYVTP